MFEYSLFHRLPVWSQVDVLTRKGNLLSQRQHKDYTISLYHLDHYFIEVWARGGLRISTSFREDAKAMAILEPYLNDPQMQKVVNKLLNRDT